MNLIHLDQNIFVRAMDIKAWLKLLPSQILKVLSDVELVDDAGNIQNTPTQFYIEVG